MAGSSRRSTSRTPKRPVLYQLCRAGERFEVGDGPIDLTDVDSLILGRGDPQRSRMGKVYVDDPWMSSQHARVVREGGRGTRTGRFTAEDMGSTNGVLVNGEQVEQGPIRHGDVLETGRTFWLYFEEPEVYELPIEPYEFGTWTTWCPRLVHELERLEKRIISSRHVLISGPEGSGKGFLARTIHLMSGRAGRLVHLDCKERRSKHLVVDLFGGGGQASRLREADMGTLFLENAHVLPRELQERLAETLKKGGFVPEGKTRRVSCDVRVVASTPVDVDAALAEGALKRRFVEGVGQIRVDLPGLDERRSDLGLLLDDFLARARGAPAFSREACRAVLMHPWRLNVKSFAKVIESAAVLAVGSDDKGYRQGRVELSHLPLEVVGREALRGLLPKDPDLDRPPSVQASVDDASHLEADPEVTHLKRGDTPSELLADDGEGDDAYLDGEIPSARIRPLGPISDDAAEPDEPTVARADAADFELDATDPALSRPEPERPEGPAVRALDPSSPSDLVSEERPPSAYYDLESVERSYASAVDPDLVVDALRRARGNVSAAARYLGKPRATLLRWIREFQLEADDYRDG